MKPRDTQRAKLYRADEALNAFAPKLPEVIDVYRFVGKVWKSERVRSAFPKATLHWGEPRIADGRGCRNARGGAHRIIIPRWARNAGVVLHELSHTITLRTYGHAMVPAHGWEFCDVYLRLTLYMLGREAHDALKAAMKKHGVRFRPKKKRAMTDEQKAALADRLKAARMAKLKEGPALLAAMLPPIS